MISERSLLFQGDKCFDIAVSKPFLGWQKYSNVSFALYRSLASLPWNHCDTQENGILFQYNGQLWAKKLLHTIKLNAVPFKFFFFCLLFFLIQRRIVFSTDNQSFVNFPFVCCFFFSVIAKFLALCSHCFSRNVYFFVS